MKQTFNYIYQYKNGAIVILKIKKKLPTLKGEQNVYLEAKITPT